MTARIEPSGDQCLIVEFGTTIDIEINRRACAFAHRLEAAALPGVLDIVPSFTAKGRSESSSSGLGGRMPPSYQKMLSGP